MLQAALKKKTPEDEEEMEAILSCFKRDLNYNGQYELKKDSEHVVKLILDSLNGFTWCAGTDIMFVSNKIGCYVHLAEGDDSKTWMCNIPYVSICRRLRYDIQKLVRLICTIQC